jgi:hypothetical protein
MGMRMWRLTGSRFGAAAKHEDTTQYRNLLRDMVWPELSHAFHTEFGEAMMRSGNDNEPLGRAMYVDWRTKGGSDRHLHESAQFVVRNAGVLLDGTRPWLAATPDFFVEEPATSWRPPAAIVANALVCDVIKGCNPHHAHPPVVHAMGPKTETARAGSGNADVAGIREAFAAKVAEVTVQTWGLGNQDTTVDGSADACITGTETADMTCAPSDDAEGQDPAYDALRRQFAALASSLSAEDGFPAAPVSEPGRDPRPAVLPDTSRMNDGLGGGDAGGPDPSHDALRLQFATLASCLSAERIFEAAADPGQVYDCQGFAEGPGIPPGTTTVTGGGEIKFRAGGDGDFYDRSKHYAKYGIPHKYFDQIQGAMELGDLPFWDVVILRRDRTAVQITRFYRDKGYWNRDLFPALRAFYFDHFLPTLELRRCGKLLPGWTVPCCPARSLQPGQDSDEENPVRAAVATMPRPRRRDPLALPVNIPALRRATQKGLPPLRVVSGKPRRPMLFAGLELETAGAAQTFAPDH